MPLQTIYKMPNNVQVNGDVPHSSATLEVGFYYAVVTINNH